VGRQRSLPLHHPLFGGWSLSPSLRDREELEKKKGRSSWTREPLHRPLCLAWNQVDANSVAMRVPNAENGEFLLFSYGGGKGTAAIA
jgi:hypothetical protein